MAAVLAQGDDRQRPGAVGLRRRLPRQVRGEAAAREDLIEVALVHHAHERVGDAVPGHQRACAQDDVLLRGLGGEPQDFGISSLTLDKKKS